MCSIYILFKKIYNIYIYLYLRIFNNNILYHNQIKKKQIDNFYNSFLRDQMSEKNINSNDLTVIDFYNIYCNYSAIFLDLIIIISIIIFLYYFFNNSGGDNYAEYSNLSLKDLEMVIKVKFEMFIANNHLTDIQLNLLNKKMNELLYNLNLGLYKGSSLEFISNQIIEIFNNII